MLLKVKGYELEIIPGKFVYFARNNEDTSYFSEWMNLDQGLRERFETMRKELSDLMEQFANSKDNAAFEAVSEVYTMDGQTDCTVREP